MPCRSAGHRRSGTNLLFVGGFPILLPQDEVVFDPRSFFDATGRLFWWRGGLYRGISGPDAPLFRQLFETSATDPVPDGVVRTVVTDLELPPFELVLQHEILPYVSYPYEWSPTMLKDAALHVLGLQLALSEKGLTLKDAHGWNVLFHHARPVQIDVGSIGLHRGGEWNALDEFLRYFVNPLRLYKRKKNRLARLLLTDFDTGVAHADLHRFAVSTLAFRVWRKLKVIADRTSRSSKRRDSAPATSTLIRLQKRVRRMDVSPAEGEWSKYYVGSFPSFEPSPEWTSKHHAIRDILARLDPETVFDIGCNTGWFSELAARMGSEVVAADPDEAAVDSLYRRIRDSGASIVPVVLDIRRPTPAQGMGYQWFQDATSRFRSDLVLALGLVHHLVFKANLAFDVIAETLASFSNRWVVVEFVPPDDRFVRDWSPERKPWYSLDGFNAALSERMTHVATLRSDPSPRVILVYGPNPLPDPPPVFSAPSPE